MSKPFTSTKLIIFYPVPSDIESAQADQIKLIAQLAKAQAKLELSTKLGLF
jgi:hypothetical protein